MQIQAVTFNEFRKFSLYKKSIKKENKVWEVKFGTRTFHPCTRGGLLQICSIFK